MSWAATRMEVADLIEGYASCYAARMPVRLREPTDFAFYLLPLLCNGGSAGFRGTTAAGATIIMDAQRSGRPLSTDSSGYGSLYFLPHKIALYEKEPTTAPHRFLLTNFAFSPFYAPRGAAVPFTAPSNVLEN